MDISRRKFIASSTSTLAITLASAAIRPLSGGEEPLSKGPFQVMGTRTGEVTESTAVVWTRLTKYASRNKDGLLIENHKDGKKAPPITVPVDQLEGACPGMSGRVRLRYGLQEDLHDAKSTDFVVVAEENDFIHQFKLTGLKANQRYYYETDATDITAQNKGASARGQFRTAPPAELSADLTFCVMTCQGYQDRDHAEGHNIYPAMSALNPHFTCLTGDLVYYDSNEPRAVTEQLARFHWQRMFSLPRLADFTSRHSTYWLKDDHDTLKDDSWPGQKVGDFSFAQGQRIFLQQAPMNEGPDYRTSRWGRDVQVWFTEGRDFRSPNTAPDGPEKTIWGAAQKEWFKRTIKESTATWKILVSPTPIIGPDRLNGKNDNHSNTSFQHEGDEIRNWLKENTAGDFFIICGDRHWQYHSVHPLTGLQEFSCGPASDQHASGSPGEDPKIHKFHRVRGGFLSVASRQLQGKNEILFSHHDVNGKVVYTWRKEKTT